jgi:hypothetical protein
MYGKLEKLLLIAYKSGEYSDSDELGRYQALVNPDGYQNTFEVKYHEPEVPGSSGSSLRFDRIKNDDFKFKLLFDGTGIISESGFPAPALGLARNTNDITDEINRFNDLTIKYIGDIHRPPFVKIVWGPLVYKGQVTKLEYDYKLFGNNGKPIRAIALVTLKGTLQDTLRLASDNPSSPDLTHVLTSREGDTLPMLCNQVYKQSERYIQIARFNNLDHFREISSNMNINFPPINKNS